MTVSHSSAQKEAHFSSGHSGMRALFMKTERFFEALTDDKTVRNQSDWLKEVELSGTNNPLLVHAAHAICAALVKDRAAAHYGKSKLENIFSFSFTVLFDNVVGFLIHVMKTNSSSCNASYKCFHIWMWGAWPRLCVSLFGCWAVDQWTVH